MNDPEDPTRLQPDPRPPRLGTALGTGLGDGLEVDGAVPAAAQEAVRDQLVDELQARLADSVADLLDDDLAAALRQRIGERAGLHAAHLANVTPVSVATAVDVMHALWGPTDPEDVGRGQWWGTSLGRACARHLAHDAAEVLTQAQAAAMLGVPRGTVGSLVHRGQLDRHPDGGVLKSSVLQRLARPT